MMCSMSFRYLLRTLVDKYNPSDSRNFSQTQYMSLRFAANTIRRATVTGATGVPTLPREHQRTVSFMAFTKHLTPKYNMAFKDN